MSQVSVNIDNDDKKLKENEAKIIENEFKMREHENKIKELAAQTKILRDTNVSISTAITNKNQQN